MNALLGLDADPAEIVHHAEEAGELGVVAEHVLVAARRAAAAESNREAFAHYRRAVDFADRLRPRERADLYEELARAAYLVERLPPAFSAINQSIALREESGDREGVGRCLRRRARFHWYAGDGQAAHADAQVAPLEDRVIRRMRALAYRVPPGPLRATRGNPAGLTTREVEVLSLVADGLTNAEIAERLHVSPRTAEHHVSALLAKLAVPTRRHAARRATELGILDRV
jgi:ATP/maltotriose-dependent transcriptional regulator MalT